MCMARAYSHSSSSSRTSTLALATLAAAAFISWLTGVALTLRPDVTSVWLCILLFFVIRFCSSAGRIFSGRGGFGQWGGDRAAVVS